MPNLPKFVRHDCVSHGISKGNISTDPRYQQIW